MEYIVFGGFAAAFLLFLFIQGMMEEKKRRVWLKNKLRQQYGQVPDKEYKPERVVRIPAYYENHKSPGQIDDITWNDLGMDDIFRRMNYTLSSTGEEYLYYKLRTPSYDKKELEHFDRVTAFFQEHEEARVRFQLLMADLGTTGKYSLYDYMEYLFALKKMSNGKEFMMLALMAASIVLLCVQLGPGIVAVLAVVLYQIFSYFKIRKEIEPYITSLAYIIRLGELAEKVQKLDVPVCESEFAQIREHVKQLNRSRRGSYFVFHDVRSGTSGNPLDALLVYVTMIFHVDLIFFNSMLSELTNNQKDVDGLVGILGYLETAVSVGMYRASLAEGWCRPEFTETGSDETGTRQLVSDKLCRNFDLEQGYHPLIKEPVKNSIHTGSCVLLTGSNASGKSTFLKTVALNVVLAQTIYTVCGDRYAAPMYRLYSSMSLRDDIESGESYYMVEIKAIKRIMEQAKDCGQPVICFVDEVLRGTNTIERIAASSQILRYLADHEVTCFAATHDLELTELLKEAYDNYHFEEEIRENDILFHYLLKPGKAKTRNAIRLLAVMGYDQEIIDNANAQAESFEREGKWRMYRGNSR